MYVKVCVTGSACFSVFSSLCYSVCPRGVCPKDALFPVLVFGKIPSVSVTDRNAIGPVKERRNNDQKVDCRSEKG